ncbi:MAG: hypothetical protein NVSMB22_01610 [Chloroflexota bacterium]
MDTMLLIQVIGLLGLRARYWAIIIVVILILLAVAYAARRRTV